MIPRFITLFIVLFCFASMQGQVDLSRLKRPDRPKIGLVLGGGGAKGAAEIGVLKALEEEGLEFDFIAGTSIGSILGALYCCGFRAAELEEMFLSQSWLTLMTDRKEDTSKLVSNEDGVIHAFGFPVYTTAKAKKKRKKSSEESPVKGFGFNNGDKIIALFDSLTNQPDSIQFDSLPIPFRCVATDVRTQKEAVLCNGNLPLAMRASMAIPGVFKPVRIKGMLLVDGGMFNNLPVDVVKDMGAEYVIAIDLTQNKHESREFSLKEAWGIGGLLDWVVSRPDWKKYNDNVSAANLYFNPSLEYDALDFQTDKIRKMIDIGYKTAKKILAGE
jgi:NTE family protein